MRKIIMILISSIVVLSGCQESNSDNGLDIATTFTRPINIAKYSKPKSTMYLNDDKIGELNSKCSFLSCMLYSNNELYLDTGYELLVNNLASKEPKTFKSVNEENKHEDMDKYFNDMRVNDYIDQTQTYVSISQNSFTEDLVKLLGSNGYYQIYVGHWIYGYQIDENGNIYLLQITSNEDQFIYTYEVMNFDVNTQKYENPVVVSCFSSSIEPVKILMDYKNNVIYNFCFDKDNNLVIYKFNLLDGSYKMISTNKDDYQVMLSTKCSSQGCNFGDNGYFVYTEYNDDELRLMVVNVDFESGDIKYTRTDNFKDSVGVDSYGYNIDFYNNDMYLMVQNTEKEETLYKINDDGSLEYIQSSYISPPSYEELVDFKIIG